MKNLEYYITDILYLIEAIFECIPALLVVGAVIWVFDLIIIDASDRPFVKIENHARLTEEDIQIIRKVDRTILESHCKTLTDLSKKSKENQLSFDLDTNKEEYQLKNFNLNTNKEIICSLVKEKKGE